MCHLFIKITLINFTIIAVEKKLKVLYENIGFTAHFQKILELILTNHMGMVGLIPITSIWYLYGFERENMRGGEPSETV